MSLHPPEVAQESEVTPQKATKEEKKKSKKEKKAERAAEHMTNNNNTAQTISDPAVPVVKKQKVRTPKDNADKPVPDYVRYLEQYHTDRSSWKFNKSKQNDVLKNVWNIYRIPPSCNDALVEYLDGLQGVAARQRLRQAAQSANIDIVSFIRTEIPEVKDEPMETAEARKAAYDSALERQKEILRKNGIDPKPEKTKTIQEQKDYDERVQLVWNTMSKGEPQAVARAAPVAKEEPKAALSMRKKRKSRTDVSSRAVTATAATVIAIATRTATAAAAAAKTKSPQQRRQRSQSSRLSSQTQRLQSSRPNSQRSRLQRQRPKNPRSPRLALILRRASRTHHQAQVQTLIPAPRHLSLIHI